MAEAKSPSQFLISLLELDTIDECDQILIVRRHKDSGISYDTNTNSRMDAHNLATLCAEWTRADIISQAIRDRP
jgi:hypothetical protein